MNPMATRSRLLAPRESVPKSLVVLFVTFLISCFSQGLYASEAHSRNVDTDDTRDGAPLPVPEIYERYAGAVVGITCRDESQSYVGSGNIVDPVGLILTSVTVTPPKATGIRVFLADGTVLPAELLRTVEEREFSLIRITRGGPFPSLALGNSDNLRLGETSVALGNAFQSIQVDGRVAISVGLISGLYSMTRENLVRAPSSAESAMRYKGLIIESSAAINDYMDGGALLNANGELVGVLSIQFSVQRWLGTAVPINELKPLFGDYRDWYIDRHQADTNYLGVELYEAGAGMADHRQIRVSQVFAGGPASRAGLRRGAILLSVDGVSVSNLKLFRSLLKKSTASGQLELEVAYPLGPALKGADSSDLSISLWRRF